MVDTRLEFGLLGPLMMTVAGSPVVLGTPKQRAVLATLLINRNRAISTDALINAAWDQSPVSASRATIHTYVSNLRRLLGGETDPNKVLVSAPPGYRLVVAEGACDLDRFSSEKTAGIHAAAAGRFQQFEGPATGQSIRRNSPRNFGPHSLCDLEVRGKKQPTLGRGVTCAHDREPVRRRNQGKE